MKRRQPVIRLTPLPQLLTVDFSEPEILICFLTSALENSNHSHSCRRDDNQRDIQSITPTLKGRSLQLRSTEVVAID